LLQRCLEMSECRYVENHRGTRGPHYRRVRQLFCFLIWRALKRYGFGVTYPSTSHPFFLTGLREWQKTFNNLRSGSRLAWANVTAAHYVAIHCPRQRTVGLAEQLADIACHRSNLLVSYYTIPIVRWGWVNLSIQQGSNLLTVACRWPAVKFKLRHERYYRAPTTRSPFTMLSKIAYSSSVDKRTSFKISFKPT